MQNIKTTITLMGAGLTLGFSLVVYAHSNFATKETVKIIKDNQSENQHLIREDIREMKKDIKEILKKI